MEDNHKSQAIVLKRQDYREYDSLVVFYTKNYGKLTLVARGTKRQESKLAGHIEPLNLVDLMIIPGKGHDYAAGAIAKEAFLDLKDNLNNLHIAFLGAFWLLRLTEEGEPDERLFNLFNNYLQLLNEASRRDFNKEEGELLFAIFAFKMLSIAGYEPQIENCLFCRKKIKAEYNYFDLKNGGLLCYSCFVSNKEEDEKNFIKISANAIKFLRFIFNASWPVNKRIKVNKETGREIALLAHNFLQFRL
jgi:DNA repair protein RecO (recombination protein O)